MLGRLFCAINLHRPDLRFHMVRGHRVVHCRDCGREMVEHARGRWRPSTAADRLLR